VRTQLRKTRRNQLLPLADQRLVRQRAWRDTSNAQLQHSSQLAPTRQRRGSNARVKRLADGVAYTQQPKKPSLDLLQNQLKLLNCQA
jgi:hypothetical protein